MSSDANGTARRPRLKDIAQKANVSLATVSLVMNNRPGVGETTRRNVLRVLEEHGYQPAVNAPADSDLGTISFVVYDRAVIQASHNPFFSAVLRGVETEAHSAGYHLNIKYVNGVPQAEEILRSLKNNPSDGILLDASVVDAPEVRPFLEMGVPTVLLDNYLERERADSVAIDNRGGTRQAVQHLIDRGHTDIGTIRTSIPTANFDERHNAFLETLQDNGLKLDPQTVFRVRPTQEGSFHDMVAHLERSPRIPSAVFSENDIIAFGSIRALKKHGVRLPEQLSVIAFDDLSFCEVLEPRLSTVRVFTERMATHAVRRLIERMRENVPEFVKIRVGTELVRRDSVAAPRPPETVHSQLQAREPE